MKTKAIRIYKYGGPEVLQYEEVDLVEPGDRVVYQDGIQLPIYSRTE